MIRIVAITAKGETLSKFNTYDLWSEAIVLNRSEEERAGIHLKDNYSENEIRKAYFSVADRDLRKQLIRSHRALSAAFNANKLRHFEIKLRVIKSNKWSYENYWLLSLGLTAAIVTPIYYLIDGFIGALIGALVAAHFNNSVMSDARRAFLEDLYEQLKKLESDGPPKKIEIFTADEENSGNPLS